MKKTILITGSTDGIGYEAAKLLIVLGHKVLLHGRNSSKLFAVKERLLALPGATSVECYLADLSRMTDVEALAKTISENHATLDVLINNAGVYKVQDTTTADALDVRFAVNTIAPYLLTKRLLPLLGVTGRVVNLSSAAQSPVDLKALRGQVHLTDGAAYAQSKLALTMWSRHMGLKFMGEGPSIISVNPGSMLASKMVKDAFGVDGADIQIGAQILKRAALTDEFAKASGKYFDNDAGEFSSPHPDGLSLQKCESVVGAIELVLEKVMRSR